MKKLIIVSFIMVGFAMSVLAEDLIVFRNGDVVKAVVLEILKSEVKYKRASNPKGPTYTVDKADLISINYENGEKDVFDESSSLTDSGNEHQQSSMQQNGGPQQIDPVPAADNGRLISRINDCTVRHGNRKPNESKLKTTKDYTYIMGITDGSILSDENISIDFMHTYDSQYIEKGKTKYSEIYPNWHKGYYIINISNKSSRPIYIDVANSFRIWPDGEAESFYQGISITNTTGKQSGGTLGLGAVAGALGVGGVVGQLSQGVGIGGGANNSTSVTTAENNIIVIPPGASIAMPKRKKVYENSVSLQYEVLMLRPIQKEIISKVAVDNKDRLEKNRYVALPYDEKNKGVRYYITYSTSPDFSTYYSVPFGFYVRGLFASKYDYDEFTSDDGLVIIGKTRWL